MAALESDDGARCFLGADHLIGREPSAPLRLDDVSVSWRHASLRWTGLAWELQDLGSRNGTFVDGERILPGSRVLLRLGSRLRFGSQAGEWHLVDADPPLPSAWDVETGERIFAEDGLIALPNAEEPEVSIYCQADGSWVAERAALVWEPKPLEVVAIGPRQFRFEPGGAVHETWSSRVDQLTPATIALEFVVSRNEEQVDLTVVHPARRIALRPRAHGYMLLTLARLRAEDQRDSSIPATSQGWVHQEQLVKMLATSPPQLAVDIFRARKQFSEAGIADAAQIVERRPTSHELRIGVANLAIDVA